MTPEQFRELTARFSEWITWYWSRVDALPVLSRSTPGEVLSKLPLHPPIAPMGSEDSADSWDAVLRDLDETILPGLTHWQSPNFFAYFPSNISEPAVLGELLCAGLGVQGMLWATSPACTELEIRVLDWLSEMLGLPEPFRSTSTGGAVIQGTASESILTAIAAARDRARRRLGAAYRPDALVAYASTQTHSSFVKACMIAGIAQGPEDRARVRLIETDPACRLDASALARAVRGDVEAGLTPFFACATLGTTATTAFDDVEAISGVLRATPAWLHVDAAHAGSACVSPEFRGMLRGVEHADSFCVNPHKWLLTNFDCDCFFVRDRRALTDALSVTPEYLRNQRSDAGEVVDFRDWHIPLGRRFRALKLWFVIRSYGVSGLQAYIREHVRLAALFEELLASDDRFELAAPRTLNLVCFRLRGGARTPADDRNRALLRLLNDSGEVYLSHAVLPENASPAGGRFVLRLAVGAARTREEHVRRAWSCIQTAAGRVP